MNAVKQWTDSILGHVIFGLKHARGIAQVFERQLNNVAQGQVARGRRFSRSATSQFEMLEARCLLAATTPLISISDVQTVEGDTGSTRVALDVTLDQISVAPVTVSYLLRSGSAIRSVDIRPISGSLTIPAGSLTGQIVTSTIADTLDELNETATVTLSNAQGGLISKAVGTITILDDDLPPTVSVANVTVTEGQSATLTLTLSRVSGLPVTVRYRTLDRTAIAPLDFTAATGSLVIPAGAKSATLNLLSLQDTVDEPLEAFTFLYNTSVGRPNQSSVVIILDDDLPALTIEDVTVKEADRGVLVQVFVTASSVSSVPITVNFATNDDTAVSGTDYQALTGIITLPAGGIRTAITFNILDDSLYEAMEMFRVVLSAPVHATLAKANGTIQITDNDLMPYASISNAVTTEGDSGDVAVVSLNTIAGVPVTIRYSTLAYTSTAGVDFISDAGTITIPAGQLSASIPLRTIEDTRSEPDESFRMLLTNPVGATLARQANIVVIKDDDTTKLPLFEPSDMVYLGAFQVPAGDVGSATFEFGGNALTFNPANNSLFMAAGVNHGLHVAEVSIPNVLSNGTTLAGMTVANVLQPFVDLGRLLKTDASGATVAPVLDYENLTLGGLIVAGGGLTGGMYMGYTGAEPELSKNSHFRTSSLNLATLTAADVEGLIDVRRKVDATDARIRGGYMAEVPLIWRQYINATHVTGAAGQNRIQFSSSGPALFGIDAAKPKGSSASALVSYPSGHVLQWSNSISEGPKRIFNGTTKVDGVAFVPGTRSVIFIGSNGLSSIGYGDGALFNDQARPYSGYHSQNGVYAYQIWAYDIDDFMAVRNGTKASWALRPTSVLNFDLPIPEASKYLGGVAFDAATNRLYVSQKEAGPSDTPVIHVYQLGRQTAATSTPAAQSSTITNAMVSVTPTASSSVFTSEKNSTSISSTAISAPLTSVAKASPSPATSTNSVTTVKLATASLAKSASSSTLPAAESSQAQSSYQAMDVVFASLAVDLNVLN
jgi:DNA-binding protein